jgi:hypothetical protein
MGYLDFGGMEEGMYYTIIIEDNVKDKKLEDHKEKFLSDYKKSKGSEEDGRRTDYSSSTD